MTQHRDSGYEHLAPLLEEYAALGPDDPRRAAIRDKLVTGHLPVVRNIARRFTGRGEPVDDLQQAGIIGLIGAVDRFQPGRGVDFLSFAVPTITGEIRRHFRDRTWGMRVPRRLKDLQSSINEAAGTLSHRLGRAPRPSEIAAHLQLPVEEVVEGLEAAQAYRSASLDELITGSETSVAETVGADDAALGQVEDHETLVPLLDELPPRERTIVMMRFFGNRTQTQIADQVGISQMHVSRLLAQTLQRLRSRMDEDR